MQFDIFAPPPPAPKAKRARRKKKAKPGVKFSWRLRERDGGEWLCSGEADKWHLALEAMHRVARILDDGDYLCGHVTTKGIEYFVPVYP